MRLTPLAIGATAVVGLLGFAAYRRARATVAPAPGAGELVPAAEPPAVSGNQLLQLAVPVALVAGGVYAFRKLT